MDDDYDCSNCPTCTVVAKKDKIMLKYENALDQIPPMPTFKFLKIMLKTKDELNDLIARIYCVQYTTKLVITAKNKKGRKTHIVENIQELITNLDKNIKIAEWKLQQ
jgi:hypothetical protein